jgi:lysophospholipase L1-like esterase
VKILIAADSLSLPRPHRINEFNPKMDNEMAVHYEETYGYLLEQALSKKYPDQAVHVINRGQRFYTIKNIHQQVADHLFFFQPDVLVIQVGVVDCWFRENLGGKQMVPLQDFEQTYKSIVLLIKDRPETKVVFIGISSTSDKMAARYPGIVKEISKYNRVLKSSADHNQIFFIDMEEQVKGDKPQQYLLPDDCHYNKDGNQLIHKLLSGIIEAIMETNTGALLFNAAGEDKQKAVDHFIHSYEVFPYFIDNLYNLLVMTYELQQFDLFDDVVQYIVVNRIQNPDLTGLLKTMKENMQR